MGDLYRAGPACRLAYSRPALMMVSCDRAAAACRGMRELRCPG